MTCLKAVIDLRWHRNIVSVCNPSQVRVPLVSSHVFTITCVSSAEIYSGLTQVYQINHMLHFLETLLSPPSKYKYCFMLGKTKCTIWYQPLRWVWLYHETMDILRHLTALVLICIFEFKGLVKNSSSRNVNVVILLVLMAFQSCIIFSFMEKEVWVLFHAIKVTVKL